MVPREFWKKFRRRSVVGAFRRVDGKEHAYYVSIGITGKKQQVIGSTALAG